MKKIIFLILILFYCKCFSQIVYIPDTNFKAKLIALGVDTGNGTTGSDPDGEIQVSEAAGVVNLFLYNSNISNLTGISYFTNLQILQCDTNNLTSLSNLPVSLTQLYCRENQLSGTLDLSMLSNLFILYCNDNILTNLILPGQSLQYLFCYNNQLQSLDVSNSYNLKQILCYNNQIQSLDCSNMQNLRALFCYNNNIQYLYTTNCVLLNIPEVSGAAAGLNFSNNPLQYLSMQNGYPYDQLYLNQFESTLNYVNVSDCTNLVNLYCYSDSNSGNISTLNVYGCSNLTNIWCYGNSLTTLITNQLTNLQNLYCGNNSISFLDLSTNTSLINVACQNNQLTSMNLFYLSNLQILNCSYNQLTSLLMPSSINLNTLYCNNNFLTDINLAYSAFLQTFYCTNNFLTTLNVCAFTSLNSFAIGNNLNLTTLYMNNGFNWVPGTSFYCFNTPNLNYVGTSPNSVGAIQSYLSGQGINAVVNTSCTLGLEEKTQETVSIFPNPTTSILNIQTVNNTQIDKIVITDLTGKKVLEQINTNQVNVANLAKGLYVVEAFYGEEKWVSKFVKE